MKNSVMDSNAVIGNSPRECQRCNKHNLTRNSVLNKKEPVIFKILWRIKRKYVKCVSQLHKFVLLRYFKNLLDYISDRFLCWRMHEGILYLQPQQKISGSKFAVQIFSLQLETRNGPIQSFLKPVT